MQATTAIYDIPVTSIEGTVSNLEAYRGKVLLIVNVASKCGFTPQYEGLEELYKKYKDRGLVVLGFPCNQFMNQEPGTEAEIGSYCSLKYNVTFPMFAKLQVNGSDTHPLYQHLKAAQSGFLGSRAIKWNFTKFIVDRQGNVVGRYSALTKPHKLANQIEKLLGEQA